MRRRLRQMAKETDELQMTLSDKGYWAMDKVKGWLKEAPLRNGEKERVRRDICEMLAEGERAGRSVEEIIGADVDDFCQSVIDALPPLSGGKRLLLALRNWFPLAAVTVVLSVVMPGFYGSGATPIVITQGTALYLLVFAVGWLATQWVYVGVVSQHSKGAWWGSFAVLIFLVVTVEERLEAAFPALFWTCGWWPVVILLAALVAGYFLVDCALDV